MPSRPILVKPRFAKRTGWTIPIQTSRNFKMAEICMAIQLYRRQFNYQKKSKNALSRILTNANTYIRHSVPLDCLFRPGVAFHFTDKSVKVDLLVCFSCNELRYYLNSQIVGGSYFKSQELLKLTKKLFPDDKKLQSLK